MKNSFKNFLDKLPGVSGNYRVFMITYYIFFAFLALLDFITNITMDNVLFSIYLLFLVLPSVIVGVKRIKTLDKRGKLNYLLLEDNYKRLENSYEALKSEVDKKQEVYDNLVQKKAKKEEQERIAKAEAEKKAKEEAEKAEKARIEKEAKAKKESSKNNQSSKKNRGTFKPSGGTASHDNRTGYDSPDSDPNEPVVTSDYGYVASGNNYIHKTANCKFIRGKSASKVSVSASGKHACNCWYY